MVAAEEGVGGPGWSDALRSNGPILLVLLGAVGMLIGLLLGGVCAVWVRESNGLVSCTSLLPGAYGSAIILGSAATGGVGLYLIFFWKESFRHTCGECGRTYRDHSLLSEHRAQGKMMCSTECAEKVDDRARSVELGRKVAALETMAVTAPTEYERAQALERLREIASYATDPVKTHAVEALRRIETG